MSYGIRRGIVEEIVSSTEYRVRIINYDSDISDPTKTLTSDLAIASVMVQPGTSVSYNEGDRVYLAFNKDELSDPVIIGSMLTEEYTTEDDQIAVPAVESAIEEIKESIDELKIDQYYTHTKYSNDNGITFTSLYEYKDNSDEMIGQVQYVTSYDIEIDRESKSIYWSIVDENSIDCTSNFVIYTTLKAGYVENDEFVEEVSNTYTETTIKVPFTYSSYEALRIDFRIVKTTDFDKYYIVLTTDKNTIGSVQGDYMGMCTTTDSEPPDDPSYYNWTSFKNTIESIVDNKNVDLESRVKKNEDTLYGTSSSEGLTDGISVNEVQVDVHGLDNKDVSFNTNKSMFIDNEENNFTTQTLKYTLTNSKTSFIDMFSSNGHLTLMVREAE